MRAAKLCFFLVVAFCVSCGDADRQERLGRYLAKNKVISDSSKIEMLYGTHSVQDNQFLVKVPSSNVSLKSVMEQRRIRPVFLEPTNEPGSYYDKFEAARLRKLIKDHAPSDFGREAMKVFYIVPESDDAALFLFQSDSNGYSLIFLAYL